MTSTRWHVRLTAEHATRTGGRKRAVPRPKTAAPDTSTPVAKRDPAQTRAIRQWAADSGYEINDRGRIPAEIEQAYHAAQ